MSLQTACHCLILLSVAVSPPLSPLDMRCHSDSEPVDRLVDLRVCISEEKTRDVQQYLLMIDDLYRDPKVGQAK